MLIWGKKLINLDFCLEKCPSAAYRRKLIFSLGMFYLYDHGTRLCMRVMKKKNSFTAIITESEGVKHNTWGHQCWTFVLIKCNFVKICFTAILIKKNGKVFYSLLQK